MSDIIRAKTTRMSDWNPTLYTRFEDQRTRPARDLLGAMRLDRARVVVDLGCGPGNSTALLAERFPDAAVSGVDSSPAMVAAARERLPTLTFTEADIATWVPPEAPDLVFANAVLQWLPDHARLLPRLLGLLRPGGVLAVQMPDNLDEPSHAAMRAVAAEAPWADRLSAAAGHRTPLPCLEDTYDLLAPCGAMVDVWRTAYRHPMAGPGAIVAWLRSTGLRPFLDPLTEAERTDFLARYEARIDAAYPPRADGQRLFAFPRVFIVATRRPV